MNKRGDSLQASMCWTSVPKASSMCQVPVVLTLLHLHHLGLISLTLKKLLATNSAIGRHLPARP